MNSRRLIRSPRRRGQPMPWLRRLDEHSTPKSIRVEARRIDARPWRP